jgi:hypothetical protein
VTDVGMVASLIGPEYEPVPSRWSSGEGREYSAAICTSCCSLHTTPLPQRAFVRVRGVRSVRQRELALTWSASAPWSSKTCRHVTRDFDSICGN